MKTITQAQRQQFKDSGVLHLPQLLDDASLQLARAAYEWSISNPGRGATNLTQGAPGTFYGDLANPKCFPAYEAVNNKTILPQIISQLWDKPEVWFLYEQVFLKVGDVNEMAKRTPWHQDLPYLPIEGMDLAVAWISFESLDKQASLEFVVGSHRGTLFDGSRFDADDDTLPLYGDGSLPRLPDIEANRVDYKIISFSVQPGDVVIFHPAMLHGGAPTPAGKTRRTLSLRFFGADAKVALRPGDTMERLAKIGTADNIHPMIKAKNLGSGAAFRDPGFPKVHG